MRKNKKQKDVKRLICKYAHCEVDQWDLSFAVAGMVAIASLTAEIQKSTTADVVTQSW